MCLQRVQAAMGVWRALLGIGLAFALAGCIASDDGRSPDRTGTDGGQTPTPTSECTPPEMPPNTPGVSPGQSGVSNDPGAFSDGGQTTGKTSIEHYLWENPSSAARITWGGQYVTGTLRLTLVDACGVTIYEGEQTAPSSGGAVEDTPQGTSGDWLLTLEFVAQTAQMGLTIHAA